LLSRGGGAYSRISETHPDVAPREPYIGKEVARWFVTERPILARFYFPFRSDETGEAVCPDLQLCKHILVPRQIFGLVVAVRFVFPKLDVLPQRVRNFHAAISALPHERGVAIAFIYEWFLLGIKIMFMWLVEKLGTT
jgi:hypothetical protein